MFVWMIFRDECFVVLKVVGSFFWVKDDGCLKIVEEVDYDDVVEVVD